MRIVFYSTNSNVFDEETFKITVMPGNTTAFEKFCAAHPEDSFVCVTQKPGMFMPENAIFLPQNAETDDVVSAILELKPDLAIAMTFWIEPYDWLPVSDALVAEKLKASGVRTICHSVECALNCFDKWRTHNLLARLGFKVPRAVFVDHDLYFCAGSNREVLRNIYKESVLEQIKSLKLPLIIKDTTGLSSYGMTVVHTYGEAAGYLNSKRNNSNRLLEEFIEGRQFGIEIYGVPGNYCVLPPFEFSVNQYGITSPKQSVKYGPCGLPDTLRDMMLELAEKLELCGCAQVDLILDKDGNWNIIEINPRLSGMSYTYACWFGVSIFELIYTSVVIPERCGSRAESRDRRGAASSGLRRRAATEDTGKVLNLKLPLISEAQMKEILQLPGIRLLNQTNDLAAKQEREKGFCECIIVAEEKSVIEKTVARLVELFPEDAIVLQSESMLKQWNR